MHSDSSTQRESGWIFAWMTLSGWISDDPSIPQIIGLTFYLPSDGGDM